MTLDEGREPAALPEQEYQARFGVVLSSRVRLARNLKEVPFPDLASPKGRREVRAEVLKSAEGELPLQLVMGEIPPLLRQELFEAHLISRAMMEGRPESAVCMDEERRRVLMVNEEDHLRIQVLLPGLALGRAWELADELDDVLEGELDYEFRAELGFLTSCPTNVGTGMRASAMMHLPGLVMLEELEPIVRALGKMGLTVRGSWGEGSAALGHMFQVSNQRTLGMAEREIVSDLEQIVLELVEHETNARARLLANRKRVVQDLVARAEAVLKAAVLMTTREALERLSELRLGVALGLTKRAEMRTVDRLLLEAQPAHLQALAGRPLKADQRDFRRAKYLRQELKRRVSRT